MSGETNSPHSKQRQNTGHERQSDFPRYCLAAVSRRDAEDIPKKMCFREEVRKTQLEKALRAGLPENPFGQSAC